MTEAILETKKWGNSIGVILPKEMLEKENIKGEHEKVFILVRKQDNTFEKTFGMLKGKIKKPTQQIKDELREELYDD